MNTTKLTEQIAGKVKIWRELQKGGETSSHQQATEFQFNELLPLIIENARLTSKLPSKAPKVMISMAGFSPETTMIAFSLLKPAYLFVLTSESATAGIERIEDLVKHGKYTLDPATAHTVKGGHFRWEPCDPTSPHDIYDRVKRFLEATVFKQQPLAPNQQIEAIVDITGGKKVMSAAAALLAWRLNAPLCYIDSVFDEHLRRPRPGSEHLLSLTNPVGIFGDEEMKTACQIFNGGHYSEARKQFGELALRIRQPLEAQVMEQLAAFYKAWCDLETGALKESAAVLQRRLEDLYVCELLDKKSADNVNRLREQVKFAGLVGAQERPAQLLCLFLLGNFYQKTLHRYDFAVLLFYRTLEGALQQRLADRFPGFLTWSNAEEGRERKLVIDYPKTNLDPAELLRDYNALFRPEFPPATELPGELGFQNSAMLLWAAGDRVLLQQKDDLNDLRNLGGVRNRSILAHGYRSVSEKDTRHFAHTAQRLLERLFNACNHPLPGGANFAERCESLGFLEIK